MSFRTREMNRIPESPPLTNSAPFRSSSSSLAGKRLTFDDDSDEVEVEVMEHDCPMADISVLRHGLNNMDVGADDSFLHNTSFQLVQQNETSHLNSDHPNSGPNPDHPSLDPNSDHPNFGPNSDHLNFSPNSDHSVGEESGFGASLEPTTPSPDFRYPARATARVSSYPETPSARPVKKPAGRKSTGEVPGTPVKDRTRSRTSFHSTISRSEVTYNIQEECNVNPFSSDPFSSEDSSSAGNGANSDRTSIGGNLDRVGNGINSDRVGYPSRTGNSSNLDRVGKSDRFGNGSDRTEERRKRPAAAMASTPELLRKASSRKMATPESGYGTRHKKLQKSDVTGGGVTFSLGSPLEPLSLSEHGTPTSRYEEEFVELEVIGAGHFGRVTKVRKRLDGVIYAIKRTQAELQKTSFSSEVVKEVFALAVLDCNPHVLRYFSSWIEGGHLYIQAEYCDAGTLGRQIEQLKKMGKKFEEEEIRRIVQHTGNGLAFLHQQMLVHLDVKPDNILISNRRRVSSGRPNSATPEDDLGKQIYKIGDLGHVLSFRDGPVRNCVDGDRRYLAPEILHDMDAVLGDAPKADVYSLGVTLFETASVGRAPVAGLEAFGVAVRNGIIPGIVEFSLSMNKLFQRMTSLEPSDRPTMYEVTSDPSIHTAHKTNSELQMDLHVAHMENFALTKELAKASRVSLKGYAPTKAKAVLLGRGTSRTNRSVSTQAF